MQKSIGTIIAGIAGAARRLLFLVVMLAIVVEAPSALTSMASRGMIDVDTFFPRQMTHTQSGGLHISGGTETERQEIRSALDQLVWPVDTSAFSVIVGNETNMPADAAGMYVGVSNVIYIRGSVADDPRQGLPYVLAHEIGHMVDAAYVDDVGRRAFLKMRGFPANTDWGSANAPWGARPCEDFAEVYASLDAPSCPELIATNSGGIGDPTRARKLIKAYAPGPDRKMVPLRTAAVLAAARAASVRLAQEPLILLWVFCLALTLGVTGATNSMNNLSYRSRRLVPVHPA